MSNYENFDNASEENFDDVFSKDDIGKKYKTEDNEILGKIFKERRKKFRIWIAVLWATVFLLFFIFAFVDELNIDDRYIREGYLEIKKNSQNTSSKSEVKSSSVASDKKNSQNTSSKSEVKSSSVASDKKNIEESTQKAVEATNDYIEKHEEAKEQYHSEIDKYELNDPSEIYLYYSKSYEGEPFLFLNYVMMSRTAKKDATKTSDKNEIINYLTMAKKSGVDYVLYRLDMGGGMYGPTYPIDDVIKGYKNGTWSFDNAVDDYKKPKDKSKIDE